ncbi:MAG: hypothetical protein M5U34_05375 [Chloroflexi bacterium]|nr:hypothetical protein [Chloroflexota bacterium]
MTHQVKSLSASLIVVLFFLTSCTLTNTSPAADLTNTPAVTIAIEETATEMTATETPSPTNTSVPAKSTRSSDAAVDMADALPSPTAEPTVAATKTPPPTTVATTADGWFIYDSAYYSYTIAYPPEATLQMEGVSGFPTDEQPPIYRLKNIWSS